MDTEEFERRDEEDDELQSLHSQRAMLVAQLSRTSSAGGGLGGVFLTYLLT